MQSNPQNGQFIRILLPLLVLSLLGAGPLPYRALQALRQAGVIKKPSLSALEATTAADRIAQSATELIWRPELWAQAGHYAFIGGAPDTAVNYFDTASASYNLQPAELTDLGDAYLQLGKHQAAITAWNDALSRSRGESRGLYERLLRAYLQTGDYVQATQAAQALLHFNPGDATLRYQYGLLLATSDPPEAIDQIQEATTLNPELSRLGERLIQGLQDVILATDPAQRFVEAGRALGSVAEWDLAQFAFQQATKIEPAYSEAWAYLGESYQHIQNTDADQEALQALHRAQEINPTSLTTLVYLAIYWQRHNRDDLAEMYLNKAIENHPDEPALQSERGNTLAHLGKFDDAHDAFLLAIQLAPNDPTYYRQLASFSIRHEYHLREIGLPAARKAISLAPGDPASLDTMAQILILLGDVYNAEKFLRHALNIDPAYSPAQLHLGLVFALRGEHQFAREQWSWVLTHAPDTAEASQAERLRQYYYP